MIIQAVIHNASILYIAENKMNIDWEVNGVEYPVEIEASPQVMIELLEKEIERINKALAELDRIERRLK